MQYINIEETNVLVFTKPVRWSAVTKLQFRSPVGSMDVVPLSVVEHNTYVEVEFVLSEEEQSVFVPGNEVAVQFGNKRDVVCYRRSITPSIVYAPVPTYVIKEYDSIRYYVAAVGRGVTVTGAGWYLSGAIAHLEATVMPGYEWVGWSDGVTDLERDVRVTSDVNLVASAQYAGLCIEASASSVLSFSSYPESLEYSYNGYDWESFTEGIEYTKVYLRAKQSSWANKVISSTGAFSVSGKLSSILDYETLPSSIGASCFYNFFSGSSVVDASDLELPAGIAASAYAYCFQNCTSLVAIPTLPSGVAVSCYEGMFKGCSSLAVVPSLPATTLASNCYNGMFYGTDIVTPPALPATNLADNCYKVMFKNCRSLASVPSLPATTLKVSCYQNMFEGCRLITSAPVLPSTTLETSCYQSMFMDCTSLQSAPVLSATNLAEACYRLMFRGCTSLTETPSLPATTLATSCYSEMFFGCTGITSITLPAQTLVTSCYNQMFYGCTSLNEIHCSATDKSASNCTTNWVYGVASEGNFYGATGIWSRGYSGIPDNWTFHYGWEGLKFIPASASTIALNQVGTYSGTWGIETSLNGLAWSAYTLGTVINLADGDVLLMRGQKDNVGQTSSVYRQFVMSGSIAASGDITSLLNNVGGVSDLSNYGVFTFNGLFQGCASLTEAPSLPVLTLVQSCYRQMFSGCSSLTTAPSIPASTLASSCYYQMFNGCTSLQSAPSLPATTLASSCYNGMFQGCTSLTTAPTLPATTLYSSCYSYMFRNCTHLTTAPTLPAQTLVQGCYYQMFMGCSLINEIHCSATDISATNCTVNWLSGVSSTGDFYGNAVGWIRGASGIPTNWNVHYNELNFTSTGVSTIVLNQVGTYSGTWGIETSLNGAAYTSYTLGTVINLADGDVVYFRGVKDSVSQSSNVYRKFEMTGSIAASGDCTSLLNNVGGVSDLSNYGAFTFTNLFSGCASLTSSPAFPSDVLSANCYRQMFSGCTSLQSAPALPATTLANTCYIQMFQGCTSLTSAPSLPATTLYSSCYAYMFLNCTSLASAPSLPALTLASNCYYAMFQGCTSLASAPDLPALTLASSCYYVMFQGCTSLSGVSALPALTLASNCYYAMFRNCNHLEGPVNISATSPYSSGTTSACTGMFVNSGTQRTGTNKYIFVGGNVADWNSTNCGIDSNYWDVKIPTALPSAAYSYNSYGTNQYYYNLDGAFYRVIRSAGSGSYAYNLHFTAGGTVYYLDGSDISTTPPVVSSSSQTIWTGVLYEIV